MAQILKILNPNDVGGPAGLHHFKTADGQDVAPSVVLDNPQITLYCIDHQTGQFVFTECPDEIDLTTVPFVYRAQKEHATHLITLSYDEAAEITQDINLPEKLILIYSTGRAGSTLMSQILSEVDDVISYSEPDVFLNLVPMIYHADDRATYNHLVDASFKLWGHHQPDKTLAIKFRGECIDIADIIQQIVPHAKNLYLYRQTEQWASSWWRIFRTFDLDKNRTIEDAAEYGNDFTGRNTTLEWVAGDAKTVTFAQSIMSLWLFYMEAYYQMCELGVPFMAVRYQDLNQERDTMLAKIFAYVDLPESELQVALQGFDRDAQAGTPLERKDNKGNIETMPDEDIQTIRDILARHALKLTPDTILPYTVMP